MLLMETYLDVVVAYVFTFAAARTAFRICSTVKCRGFTAAAITTGL